MTDPKIPAQEQNAMPGAEHKMDPAPDYMPRHPGVGKLKDKVAFISGGDSGIGRAVSVLFAREGPGSQAISTRTATPKKPGAWSRRKAPKRC